MWDSAMAYVVGPPVIFPGPLPGAGGSPSWDINVPVFLLMGEFDGPSCGPTGPIPVCYRDVHDSWLVPQLAAAGL